MIFVGTITGRKTAAILVSIAFNVGFYIGARPVPVTNKATAVFDVYEAKHTLWSVQHEYFKKFRDVYGSGGPGTAQAR